jgi:hypothetical protein
MANQWFKMYGGEYLSDPKIGSLNAQERSCWVTLMCLASTSSEEGVIEYLTPEVLLEKSGIRFDPNYPEEWERMLKVLDKFEAMKMVMQRNATQVTLHNWNKRQERNATATERSRKYRAKLRSLEGNATHATKCNANETLEENRIEENRIDNTNTLVAPDGSDRLEKPKRKKIQTPPKEENQDETPEFNSDDWIKINVENTRPHIRLIGYYFLHYTEHNFPTKEVAEAELKKNVASATWLLKNFKKEDIVKTMKYCKEKYAEIHWNLVTVKKQISYVTAKKG